MGIRKKGIHFETSFFQNRFLLISSLPILAKAPEIDILNDKKNEINPPKAISAIRWVKYSILKSKLLFTFEMMCQPIQLIQVLL